MVIVWIKWAKKLKNIGRNMTQQIYIQWYNYRFDVHFGSSDLQPDFSLLRTFGGEGKSLPLSGEYSTLGWTPHRLDLFFVAAVRFRLLDEGDD